MTATAIPVNSQTAIFEIVTDVDRLNELPPHAAILEASDKPEYDHGDLYSRLTLNDAEDKYVWYNDGWRTYRSSDQIKLPVTVVFMPTKFREGTLEA